MHMSITAYLEMIPLLKQLCTLCPTSNTAAVSVCVHYQWGILLGPLVSEQKNCKWYMQFICLCNLSIIPIAIGRSPSSPSDSVSTEISTSPRSFPTLVHQAALSAAIPCSFLHTFLVESIFKTFPKTPVQVARI